MSEVGVDVIRVFEDVVDIIFFVVSKREMNRFAAFADETEQPAGQQPVKAQAAPKETKKVVVKKPKTSEGQQRPQGGDDGEY